MMRVVKSCLLACALAAVLGPGAAVAQETAPGGVAVVSFEWHPRHRAQRRDNYDPSGRDDFALNDPASPRRNVDMRSGRRARDEARLSLPSPNTPYRVFNGYESSVHLKNDGAKTVRAVEWEHVFYNDAAKQDVLRRFRFRKKAKVEPGAQRFVAGRVNVRDYSPLPARSRQAVELKRIEYSDGSVWQSQ